MEKLAILCTVLYDPKANVPFWGPMCPILPGGNTLYSIHRECIWIPTVRIKFWSWWGAGAGWPACLHSGRAGNQAVKRDAPLLAELPRSRNTWLRDHSGSRLQSMQKSIGAIASYGVPAKVRYSGTTVLGRGKEAIGSSLFDAALCILEICIIKPGLRSSITGRRRTRLLYRTLQKLPEYGVDLNYRE